MRQLKSRSSVAIVAAVALLTGIGLARQRAMGAGFHVVTLPSGAQASERVETRVLLETPHLKLASVSIPRGGVLPPHSAPSSVSLQALSGSGEVLVAGVSERIDGARMIVLAPGVEHEVRAAADSRLVVLVHHVLPGAPAGGPARK